MRGQLYKIAGGDTEGHAPAGDLVYWDEHSDEFVGFVLRQLPDNVFLIVLMEPCELPPGAELVLEVCDATKMMQEEARNNPAFRSKMMSLLRA